jgi:hypothetical protein
MRSMEKIDLVDRHSLRIAQLHSNIGRKTNFFPGQRVNEEVRLAIRSHWFRDFMIIFRFLFIGLAIPAAIFFLFSFVEISKEFFDYSVLFLSVYLLVVWLLTFVEFLKSELTIIVVTSDRVVNIMQTNIFDREIAETNLDRIQEVLGFVHGILGTLLDIGRLEIQTAGSDIPLVMSFVKSPQLTARKILDVQKMGQNRRRSSDFARREDDEVIPRAGENLSAEKLRKMREDTKSVERRDQDPI